MISLFTNTGDIPKSFLPPLPDAPIFQLTQSVETCDYILLPFWETLREYTDKQYAEHHLDPAIRQKVVAATQQLIEYGHQYNKKMIVFYWSDLEEELPLENAVIFRNSLYKSRQQKNEFAFPSWNGDFIMDYMDGKAVVRDKDLSPKVGFRGSARPLGLSAEDILRTSLNMINTSLDFLHVPFQLPYQWNEGQILRTNAIKTLQKNKHIQSDFKILTRGYISQNDPEVKAFNRKKFIDNIVGNDYVLCVRGAGNYSYRFYETISAGRIPLFINSDCVLPFDFIIDWKKYCVWVEKDEIEHIDEILIDFHNKLSASDFKDLQHDIRKIWDNWIAPDAFFNHLEACLKVVP